MESEFNEDFIKKIIPRLDWPAVFSAAEKIGANGQLPAEIQDSHLSDPEFLKRLHHILFEIDIIEGELQCPETGRKFPISDGIPNMLLNEDEV